MNGLNEKEQVALSEIESRAKDVMASLPCELDTTTALALLHIASNYLSLAWVMFRMQAEAEEAAAGQGHES